jgi:hypothetical protein
VQEIEKALVELQRLMEYRAWMDLETDCPLMDGYCGCRFQDVGSRGTGMEWLFIYVFNLH